MSNIAFDVRGVVESLRKHVAGYKSLSAHRQQCLVACDEIERLREEKKGEDYAFSMLGAENEKLRAALEEICKLGENSFEPEALDMVSVAEKAINGPSS